ncbi:MAG: rhodanese-like domain-containing protein, partial [Caldilinea sp.]
MSMSQTDFRRYVVLILIAIGLLWSLNACSAGQPAAAASQPVAAAVKVKAKITPAEYQARFGANADHVLIDVRTPEEFAGGHIPGA